MNALPLCQPWATLGAIGAKRVETRGYPPSRLGLRCGERIAIHGTRTTRELWCCALPHFRDHLPDPEVLLLGALLATCALARPVPFRGSRGAFHVPDHLVAAHNPAHGAKR